jgi:Ser/Thr protein kinase RdoA (MazF antagonist)
MIETEIPLLGGRVTQGVVRVGDTVRRPMAADRSSAQALLRHLEIRGFDATPRFIGIDPEGREILSYLPGDVPIDLGHYDDATLKAAAALLRRFHDATADFPNVQVSGAEVMCHNDWGPPNAVFVDGVPAGIIDFDTVKPGLRLWDLGYSAMSWLDLGDDGYTGEQQIARLGVFADGYGCDACSVESIAAFAVARQTALSAAGKAKGQTALADWAAAAASWTVANVTERLLPTGMMP